MVVAWHEVTGIAESCETSRRVQSDRFAGWWDYPGHDHKPGPKKSYRTLRGGRRLHLFPSTSCQATFICPSGTI
jgi:hypothetical protein